MTEHLFKAIRIEDNIIKGSATVTQKEQLFHPNTQTMHLIRIYIKIAQYARNKVTICNWSRPFFSLLTEEKNAKKGRNSL